jgi:hypothetical protein
VKELTENSTRHGQNLVNRIQTGEKGGMEELHRLFSKGLRFYLYRRIGPQASGLDAPDSYRRLPDGYRSASGKYRQDRRTQKTDLALQRVRLFGVTISPVVGLEK